MLILSDGCQWLHLNWLRTSQTCCYGLCLLYKSAVYELFFALCRPGVNRIQTPEVLTATPFLGWKMSKCLVLADVLMIRKILYLVCFVSFRKKWGIRLNLVSRWFDVLRNSELSMVRKQKIRCLSGPLICGHPVLTRNPMPDQTLQYTIILNLVCFSVLTQCHDVPSWEDSPATRVLFFWYCGYA